MSVPRRNTNSNLHGAKRAKNDEFFTRLQDIEAEVAHYVRSSGRNKRNPFEGAVVYLNCDDPFESNFFKYFAMKFRPLGLKALIATTYVGSYLTGKGLALEEIAGLRPALDAGQEVRAYGVELTDVRDVTGDGEVGWDDIEQMLRTDPSVAFPLEGDGDFRSEECVELLRRSDVVVTNPPFSCHDSQTDVLTDQGWKRFEDVADNDLICSLNLEMDRVEYVRFVERYRKRVDGELLHFSSRALDVMVTEDHRMVARTLDGSPVRVGSQGEELLIRADEVKKSYRLPRAGFSWRGQRVEEFVLPGVMQTEQYTRREIRVPERRIDMGDWLEFFGFWLADGHVRQGLNVHGHPRYMVSITQDGDNEQHVLDLFSRIGFEAKPQQKKGRNTRNYEVYSKQLWTYLEQFGVSETKFVPRWVLKLDTELLQRFWDGYTAGDGQLTEDQVRLGSVSRQLMEDMQEVVLKLFGRVVSVRSSTHVTPRRGIEKGYYQLIWNPDGKNNVASQYGAPQRVEYHDDVHCLELERNGVMLVRRNGKVSWSGNCFREYVAQLIEHDKKFLIIGSKNAITYKEIFPLIKGTKLWIGGRPFAGGMWFEVPAGEVWDKEVDGKQLRNVPSCWFTNLDHRKRHEELDLVRYYEGNEDAYPRYDNYDAIEVSKVKDIPADYEGVMGVPITFLDKHNPEQFEIVGSFNAGAAGVELGSEYRMTQVSGKNIMWNGPLVAGKPMYKRIMIRNLNPQKKIEF